MPRRSPPGAPRRPCPTRSPRPFGRRSPNRFRAARAEDAARTGRRRAREAVTAARDPAHMPPDAATSPASDAVIRTRRRGRIRPLEQIPVWHGFETIAEPGGQAEGGPTEPGGVDALLA